MSQSQSFKLLGIQVGRPRVMGGGAGGRPWRSAIVKQPVHGPVWVGVEGVEGDRQVAPQHGGAEMAVLAYAAGHYPLWRAESGRADIGFGGFGENMTIEGLDETTVCLGDVFEVGGARLQVSQPRTPCWKLERLWDWPGLVERVIETGRHGWFFRVLREGEVAAGQSMHLLERPLAQWPIARIATLKHLPPPPPPEEIAPGSAPAYGSIPERTPKNAAAPAGSAASTARPGAAGLIIDAEAHRAAAAELADCPLLAPGCRKAMGKIAATSGPKTPRGRS